MKPRNRRYSAQMSVGGLATGLGSFYQSLNSVWIGWPGVAANGLTEGQKQDIEQQLGDKGCHPVFLTREEVDTYYNGFCNNTLWPLFHYFPLYARYNPAFWEAYKAVNEHFCQVVNDLATSDDTIWVQDYQLLLLPGLIRRSLPRVKIGFFLHIPFPSSEVFRLLPWREELLEDLLGADLIGFHTYDYVRHFLTSVRRLLGYSQMEAGKLVLSVKDRVVKVDAFPMGVDYDHYAEAATSPETQIEVERIRREIGPRKVILSVDRLDYTKGLIQRLEAYNLFLTRFPEYEGKVTFVLKAIASRSGISQYQALKRQLDEQVGRINGEHGTLDWMPVWYLFRFLPAPVLSALYSLADVALLTPLRDGMNLIAKEFLASKHNGKGVLILSEMAGAAQELPEALIVNPNNKEEIAQAIQQALTMSEAEQEKRNRIMQERLRRYNVTRWAEDFLDRLTSVRQLQDRLAARRLTTASRNEVVKAYHASRKRLLLLDYDGTLVPFAAEPEEALPDRALLDTLYALTGSKQNTVLIISGRDRDTLERWFGGLDLTLVAEHGAWIKERHKPWRTFEPLTNEWKEEIRPLLKLYVDRTPGSTLEEKEFSLVWHFRKADEVFAEVRVSELKGDLAPVIENRPFGVLEGDRVLEVKHAGINKGRIALEWIEKRDWDFVFAVGDDATDEDTFRVLPKTAYSIKVGFRPSQARFNLESPQEVRDLLNEFITARK